MLEAAYGNEQVAALEAAGLLEQPLFININRDWCAVAGGGGWQAGAGYCACLVLKRGDPASGHMAYV